MKELRKTGITGPMSYDPDNWTVDVTNPQLRVNLANLHADLTQNMPWRRSAIIRRFVSHLAPGVFDRPRTLDEASPLLLPNLRDSAMWEFLRLDADLQGLKPLDPPRIDLTSRLSSALYVDAEHGMSMVTNEDLERWEICFDEGMILALENLSARSNEAFLELTDGVWASPWSDCYDTARLLLPDKLREVEVDGNLVAFCPHWNTLLLTGSNDIAGLAGCLDSSAQQITEAPKPLTAQPIMQRYPGWEMLRFGRGHQLFNLWAKARVFEMVGLYRDQQSVLEQWYKLRGDDVYIAHFNGVEQKDSKETRSYCVWGKGVVALLPEADEVVFFEDDKPEEQKVTRIDWDVMWTVCEPLLALTDHVPVRWRVASFPDSDSLQRMREMQEHRTQH